MNIAVDAGSLGVDTIKLKVGVYFMTLNWLSHLALADKKNTYRLYSFNPIEQDILDRFGNNQHNIVLPRLAWHTIWLPLDVRVNTPDIFLGFSQSLPKLLSKTKSIVFIYDLTFEKHPEWFKNTYMKMSSNTKYAVRNASHIVASSNATKKDLIDIYSVDKDKISVIYGGYDNRFSKIPVKPASLNIKTPFFLFVGTLKQSKNIPIIIEAFSIFSKMHKNYNLVVVGSDLWIDPEIKKTIEKFNLGKKVKRMGYVSDEVLSALYKKTECFVSPSVNEGFGLTFLEAAYHNIPIIASKRGSIPEVLGNNAVYVDPDSATDISNAFVKILDKGLSKAVSNKARRYIDRFSWQNSTQKLLKLINQI